MFFGFGKKKHIKNTHFLIVRYVRDIFEHGPDFRKKPKFLVKVNNLS